MRVRKAVLDEVNIVVNAEPLEDEAIEVPPHVATRTMI